MKMPQSSMQRTSSFPWFQGILLILSLGGMLRLILAWQNLLRVDSLFLVDDSYFSLGIARNIALGYGSTFDLVVPTNGYQPLFVWMMVPVYMLFQTDRVIPIHIALSLLVGCSMLTGWFIIRIAAHLTNPTYGLVAGALWMFDFNSVRHGLNGLETALAVCCMAATLDWYLRHIQAKQTVDLSKILILGALSGFSILARIDQGFILVAMLFDMLLRQRQWQTVLHVGSIGFVALLVNLPWMLFGISIGAGPFPSSGEAVRLLASIEGINTWKLSFTIFTLLISIIVSSQLSVFMFIVSGLVAFIVNRIRSKGNEWLMERWRQTAPLRFLLVGAGIFFLAYWLYIPSYWYFERYLHPLAVIGILFTVCLLPKPNSFVGLWRYFISAICITPILIGGFSSIRTLWIQPPDVGFIPIARWIDNNLPGETIGTFQSGTIGYWATSFRVVNLDGVVDHAALRTRQRGELPTYIRQRKITLIVDWVDPPGSSFDTGVADLLEPGKRIPALTTYGNTWYIFRVKRKS